MQWIATTLLLSEADFSNTYSNLVDVWDRWTPSFLKPGSHVSTKETIWSNFGEGGTCTHDLDHERFSFASNFRLSNTGSLRLALASNFEHLL